MKNLVLITLTFLSFNLFSQDIEGKWLLTVDGDTYTIPEVMIMKFENDIVTTYNFDKFYSSHKYTFIENSLKINDSIFGKVEFLSPRKILITDKSRNELYFVRIDTTKTDLTFNEIDQLKFSFNWNNEFAQVDFKNKKQEFPEIKLEEINSTYFISFFEIGKRRLVLPIKSVDNNEIKIYGFPREPNEIIAKIKR